MATADPKTWRRPGVTRISRKNQITIPGAALVEAHMEPGDELRIEAQGDGRLVLIRVRRPWEELVGSMPGLSAATKLDALRDDWER